MLHVLGAVAVAALCIAALGAGVAKAQAKDNSIYIVTTPGTGAPPATLGQFFMTGYGLDVRLPRPGLVANVPSPNGAGPLWFSYPVSHVRVPTTWASWSNGYTGDVYWNNGGGDLNLQIPSATRAFYLYVEPDLFTPPETVTVTCSGAQGFAQATVTTVSGTGGAQYFGCYTPDGTLSNILVHDPTSGDFAVGEFGLNYQKLRKIG